jgi:platelet-activating factor acetylhydrolase IB subunit alpha
MLTTSRHKSIIAYLAANNLTKSADTLRQELGLDDSFDNATRKQYETLLEKKWTSVLRQQKKVSASS